MVLLIARTRKNWVLAIKRDNWWWRNVVKCGGNI